MGGRRGRSGPGAVVALVGLLATGGTAASVSVTACVGGDPATDTPNNPPDGTDSGAEASSTEDAGTCGDGRRGTSEECDGDDLDGKTCATAGAFYAGTLRCTAACGFDTSGCFGPPSVPALRRPMNGSYRPRFSANARRPTFEWAPSTLAGPNAAISYELQYGTDATFAEPIQTTTVVVPDTSYVVTKDLTVDPNVPVGAHHYWRVRACVGAACSDYSRTWHLHVWRSPGDLDGDGYDDLIVSAPLASGSAGADVGRLHFYRGGSSFSSSTTPTTFEGALVDQGLGHIVRRLGDFDGDGFSDVIVADPQNVRVFFGAVTGPFARDRHVIAHNGGWKNSIAGAGDVNGDGYADVILGKPGAKQALLFFGGKTPGATPSVTITHTPATLHFGKMVVGAGDLNGDGFADIAIGGSYYGETPGDPSVNPAVWVFFGAATGAPSFAGTVEGTNDTAFGYAASGCDVNGDGFSDLVVGRPKGVGTDGLGGGSVYRGGPGATFSFANGITLGQPNGGVYGMGESVACGDLNGDGFADIALGSPYTANTAAVQGSVVLYLGASAVNATPSAEYLGAPSDWHGFSVAIAGDLDGDGVADLAVTSPGHNWYSATATAPGKMVVYKGKALPLTNLATFTTATAGDGFGASVGP